MRYLTAKQILLIHSMVIDETGGAHGVREHHAILSLVALPKQKFFGKETYRTIFEKAAVYTRGVISVHPFLDGNKRTAIVCASVFLDDNGYRVISQKGDTEKFAIAIVNKKFGIPEIAKWFDKNSEKDLKRYKLYYETCAKATIGAL